MNYFEYCRQNFSKALQTNIAQMQEAIKTGLHKDVVTGEKSIDLLIEVFRQAKVDLRTAFIQMQKEERHKHYNGQRGNKNNQYKGQEPTPVEL